MSKDSGTKLDNKNSIFSRTPKKPSPKEFKEKIDEVVNKDEEYKSRIADLALKFKSILIDKTLSENKTSISTDIELEVLRNLLALEEEMNCDENQKEGQGSTAISAILLKMFLIMRDRQNLEEYRLEKLEKEIKNISNSIENLTKSLSDKKNA